MRDAPSFAPSALRLALPPVEQRQQERDVSELLPHTRSDGTGSKRVKVSLYSAGSFRITGLRDYSL